MRGSRKFTRRLRLLAILPLFALPVPLAGQSAEARAEREAYLRQIQEELAAAREAQTAKLQALREEMSGERARAMEEHRTALRAREHELQERQEVRSRELVARLREARELTAERMDELQERLRETQERARQVVIRMRSGIRLGVTLDMEQGEEYDSQGVLVKGVIRDSPAEDAGLEDGDIITHLNGQNLLNPIPDEDEEDFDEDGSLPVQRLMALAGDLEEGDEVTLGYLHDGAAATLSFEVEEIDSPFVWVGPDGVRGMRGGVFSFDPEGRSRWSFRLPEEGNYRFYAPNVEVWNDANLDDLFDGIHVRAWDPDEIRSWSLGEGDEPFNLRFFGRWGSQGLELAELNPGLAEYFSTDQGVLVLDVDEDSELGLQPGDVILRIGDRDVEDPSDVYRILGSYEEDEAVTFTVMRDGSQARVEGMIG